MIDGDMKQKKLDKALEMKQKERDQPLPAKPIFFSPSFHQNDIFYELMDCLVQSEDAVGSAEVLRNVLSFLSTV